MLTEKPKKETSAFQNEMPSITSYNGADEVREFAFTGAGQKDNFKGAHYEGGCGPWYDKYLRAEQCSKVKG